MGMITDQVLAALNSETAAFTEHDIAGQRIPKLCLKLSDAKTNSCINLQLNPPHVDVFLYGAGHVGRAVAEIAQHLCCQLYWVDTQENRFPEIIPIGVTKICASSPSHIAAHAPENSIHLVMTYSHQIDYDVVSCLLSNGHFARCGLIGSETKAARFRSRLLNAGVASEQIERLVCPIGLGEIQEKPHFRSPCQLLGSYHLGLMIAMSDDLQHRVDTTLGLQLHHKQSGEQNINWFLKDH